MNPLVEGAAVPDGYTTGVQTVCSEVTPRFYPPLNWWRLLAAEVFRRVDIRIMRRAMRLAERLDDPRWIEAMRGDAPAAIGLAVWTVQREDLSSRTTDLAMTALVCCALEGSASAAIVIASVLRRRVAIEPACAALETSWYFVNVSNRRPLRRRSRT